MNHISVASKFWQKRTADLEHRDWKLFTMFYFYTEMPSLSPLLNILACELMFNWKFVYTISVIETSMKQ